VRISNVSIDGELDEFGGRALIVSTDRGMLKTPQRALTSSELQYKAKLPSDPPINNDLSEIVSFYTTAQWDNFIRQNGSFRSRLRTLEFYGDKMGYTLRRFFPKIPKKVQMDKDSVKYLLELQRMSSLDFITMPNVPSIETRFEELVSGFSEEVLSERREPLVYLDMGLEASLFESRFNELLELADTGLIHTIGLQYKPIKDASVNYLHIWRNREAKVLIQMSDVPRNFGETSTMHLLQKWGIDTFSVRLNAFRGGGKGDGSGYRRPFDYSTIRRLDQKPLLFKEFSSWMHSGNDLDCECPVCRNHTISDFVDKFTDVTESYDGEIFSAATRLHEYYMSSEEFKKGRDYIRNGELDEYFQRKDGLRESDSKITQPMMTLNGWL
jgi:hypothetical protein